MESFKLKIPVHVYQQMGQKSLKSQLQNSLQQRFIKTPDSTTTTVEADNLSSFIIGILTSVLYYCFFFYLYGSSAYKKKIEFINITENKNFTLSEAFEGSEKIGTTIFISLMSGLFLSLLIEQGFVSKSSTETETSVLVTNFIFLFAMLVLIILGPYGSYTKMGFHVLASNMLIIFCIYNALIIPAIYSDVFESSLIEDLQVIGYVLTGMAFFILVFYIFLIYSRTTATSKNPKIPFIKFCTTGISLTEIFFALLFGSVFAIFGSFPRLVHKDKECVAFLGD